MAAMGSWAQQVPSAGAQLQQIPVAPILPTTPAPDSQPAVAQPQPISGADTRPVLVQVIVFTGNLVFAAPELEQSSGFNPGTRYTLADLRKLASKVTAHYRDRGYFLAQTLLPAQDITEGMVRFTVMEGHYGQIGLDNQSGVADGVANALLQGLQDTGAVNQEKLERHILLLNDLPGVQARSTLRPGSTPGTADLLVNLAAGSRVNGSVEADNQGNHYTGVYRLGAAMYVNELLGWGDVASVRLLSSGEGLSYGRAAYQLTAGTATLGLAASSLYYRVGESFASLQSSGSAQTGTVFTSYPLVRARRQNLSIQWSLDYKDFDDRTGAGSPSHTTKNSRRHTLGLKGDFQDGQSNAAGRYALSWAHGTINLQDATTRDNDASSAQSNGDFDKLGYSFSWQQENPEKRTLYVSVTGQAASKNLDASEKFSLGGPGGVRAYPSGEASGDEGLVLTLEVRTPWPALSQYLAGTAQAVAFIDVGTELPNKNPWDAGASAKRRTLSGTGVGLNFASTAKWTTSAYCAFKLGDETASAAPDAAWRLWFQAAKFF